MGVAQQLQDVQIQVRAEFEATSDAKRRPLQELHADAKRLPNLTETRRNLHGAELLAFTKAIDLTREGQVEAASRTIAAVSRYRAKQEMRRGLDAVIYELATSRVRLSEHREGKDRHRALWQATEFIKRASSPGIQKRMRRGLDLAVLDVAISCVNNRQFSEARQVIKRWATKPVRAGMLPALDASVFERAQADALEGNFALAVEATAWASDEQARLFMRRGLDAIVFDAAFAAAKRDGLQAAEPLVAWASDRRAQQQIRDDLRRTLAPPGAAHGQRRSTSTAVDVPEIGPMTVERQVRVRQLESAASPRSRGLWSAYSDVVLLAVDQTIRDAELEAMAADSETPLDALIDRISEVLTEHGVQRDRMEVFDLLTSVESAQSETGTLKVDFGI